MLDNLLVVGQEEKVVCKRRQHPRAVVSAKYPNASKNDVLDNLLAVGQEEKVVCKRRQVCIVMRHDDFDDGRILPKCFG